MVTNEILLSQLAELKKQNEMLMNTLNGITNRVISEQVESAKVGQTPIVESSDYQDPEECIDPIENKQIKWLENIKQHHEGLVSLAVNMESGLSYIGYYPFTFTAKFDKGEVKKGDKVNAYVMFAKHIPETITEDQKEFITDTLNMKYNRLNFCYTKTIYNLFPADLDAELIEIDKRLSTNNEQKEVEEVINTKKEVECVANKVTEIKCDVKEDTTPEPTAKAKDGSKVKVLEAELGY